MKKIIIVLTSICIILGISTKTIIVNAETQSRERLLIEYGEITQTETIEYRGYQLNLYCTFTNQQDSLNRFINKNNSVLETISTEQRLESLSDDNYRDYYIICKSKLLSGELDVNEYKVYSNMLSFFDVYENAEKNTEIKSMIEISNKNEINIDEYLATNLPYSNDFVTDYWGENDNEASRSFSVSAANSYASANYNNTSNSTYGYLSAGDCANFCSQILIAGGETQVNSFPDVNSGWWHVNVLGVHKYSRSWTLAHKFVTYHSYSSFQTRVYSTFTRWLAAGSFIAYDKYNDGDWDHVGYVTQVDSYKTNGYYDHKIAQHSSEYHKWAQYTGWPALEDGVCWFIIVRGCRSTPQP